MTFTQLVTVVKDYALLSSSDAEARIGRAINRHYRRITSELGLDATRFVTRSVSMTVGQRAVTFTEIEKIDRVIDTTDSTAIIVLDEVSLHDLRREQPGTGAPTKWALQNTDADSVIILTDTVPQAAWDLQADGVVTLSDLSGSDEPIFPESFHDILAWYVVWEELLKKEKDKLAATYKQKADELVRELKFRLAESHTRTTRQGGATGAFSTGNASGGGAGTLGGTAYTQTALLTFNRGAGTAPFAVLPSDAPYVVNLGAEFLGNITTDRLIGRDTAGTGETEQLTVGNGLGFTGSGGIGVENDGISDARLRDAAALSVIGRSANSTGDPADIAAGSDGHVLRRSGTTLGFGTVATAGLADDAVTYAKMQDISAASKVLGRGSAGGSGSPEELSLGSGLAASATTLYPTTFKCQGRLTLTTGTPVTTSDVTGAGTLYFTPYNGNRVELYDGTSWSEYAFAERSLVLAVTSGKNYDVFLYSNAGTLTLELSAAWTTDTARADALTTQDGVIVKSGALTRLYLGTIRASGANTTEDSREKRYVWNNINRVRRPLRRTDSTNSWTYTTAAFQQANAAAANQVDVVVGQAVSLVDLAVVALAANGSNPEVAVGIGEDSATVPHTSFIGGAVATVAGVASTQITGRIAVYPSIGRHYYTWLEYSTAVGTTTWYGDNNTTRMANGLHGTVDA